MMPATRTRCELRRTPLLRLYEKSRMHRRRSFQNYRNATFWPISLHRLTGFAVEASLEPTFHTVSLRAWVNREADRLTKPATHGCRDAERNMARPQARECRSTPAASRAMPAAPEAASRRSNRPPSPTASARTVATNSAMNRTVAHHVGRAQRRQPGTRFMAEARKNPAATNSTNPTALRAASSFPPEFASCAAWVQPGSASRHASRSNGVSRLPRPGMDKASRTDPTVALQPPGRSDGRRESAANRIVATPHKVKTTTRKAPFGAPTAYMSLMVWARTL